TSWTRLMKGIGRGSATNDGKRLSRARDPRMNSWSIRAVSAPAADCTSIVAGPVSRRPSVAKVSGNVNRRQRQRAPPQSVSMPRGERSSIDETGLSAGPVTPVPSTKVSVTTFPLAAFAKTASCRSTTTSSPGEANGVVTSPTLDGKLVGAAGITLHAAPASVAALPTNTATVRTQPESDLTISPGRLIWNG